jgi:hypothetical protein
MDLSAVGVPLEARRAARLDGGPSTSTVRVPQCGTYCVPRQVELRSRPIEAGSAGAPRECGARLQGRPSLGYLSWPRKKGNQPPGCPRPLMLLAGPYAAATASTSSFHSGLSRVTQTTVEQKDGVTSCFLHGRTTNLGPPPAAASRIVN